MRDIDDAFIARTTQLICEARSRSAGTANEADEAREATLEFSKTAAALYSALQGIQSAAKQKHRLLAIDGDPATNFSIAGYLIGTRLNGSLARLDRDDLLDLLNNHRSAMQHAADAIWPWSNESNRPTRKTFNLPLTRPLGL